MKNALVRPLTEFGISIKITLMNKNKTQNWLIAKMKEKTGLYVDSSLLYKILTGQNTNPKLLNAIEKILGISL